MKKIIFAIFITVAASSSVFSQGKVKIFNTVLNVRDIIGATLLHDQKWNKELKDVLVTPNEYPYETIGSYRNNFNSIEPNMLFNLVDKGNYPLLDQINMGYYEDVVLPKLKGDPKVKTREDFIKFCAEWAKTSEYTERKNLLFKDEFIEIGNLIQAERFTVTTAPFDLANKVTQKFNSTVTAGIKENLQANNIKAEATLVNYLSSIVNSQTTYKGTMMIIQFRNAYMNRIAMFLNELPESKMGNDLFSIALRDFAAPGSTRMATTGMVVFKLDGSINKNKITENSLKTDLSAKFSSLGADQIGEIAASIGIGFVSKVESLFSAEIKNTYIKNLLTSGQIDKIEYNKVRKALQY